MTAYHEAGHAFIATQAGARVVSLTIAPDHDDGPQRYGETRIEWPLGQFSQADLAAKAVLVALAGPVAEMIHRGEPYHPGVVPEWVADWQEAWSQASAIVPDERKRLAYLERRTLELYQVLNRDDYWAALAAIVDNLLAHEYLEGEEVSEIVEAWVS